MGRRIAIVGGVIAGCLMLAVATISVFVSPRKTAPISARYVRIVTDASGKNHAALIEVTNRTDRLCNVTTWSEYQLPGSSWLRTNLAVTQFALNPHANQNVLVPLPARTDAKRRVTLLYGQSESGLRYWMKQVRTALGIKPFEGNRLHVEVAGE